MREDLDLDSEVLRLHNTFYNLLLMYYFFKKNEKDIISFSESINKALNLDEEGGGVIPSIQQMPGYHGVYYNWPKVLEIHKGSKLEENYANALETITALLHTDYYFYYISTVLRFYFKDGKLAQLTLDELLFKILKLNKTLGYDDIQFTYFNYICGHTLAQQGMGDELMYALYYISNYSKQSFNLTEIEYTLAKKKHKLKVEKEKKEKDLHDEQMKDSLPLNLGILNKCFQMRTSAIKSQLTKIKKDMEPTLNQFNSMNFFLSKSSPEFKTYLEVEKNLARTLSLFEICLNKHGQEKVLIDVYVVLVRDLFACTLSKTKTEVLSEITKIDIYPPLDEVIKGKVDNISGSTRKANKLIPTELGLSELSDLFS